MIALALVTIILIVRSNRRFKARKEEEKGDAVFNSILASDDKNETWNLLLLYIGQQQQGFLLYVGEMYDGITQAFLKENVRALGKAASSLERQKNVLKNVRRKETLCLRKVAHETALEKNPWFHLSNNCLMSVLYNLRRIDEICKEHVENNFRPLPERQTEEFELIRTRIGILFNDMQSMMESGSTATVPMLRRHCDEIKDSISDVYHGLHDQLHDGDPASMTVLYVYMNILSETQEMISAVRKYMRAYAKLRDSEFRSRPIGRPRVDIASTDTGDMK